MSIATIAQDQVVETQLIDAHDITQEQLLRLGLQDVAYVKAIQVDGKPVFAIHAADGSPMALAAERDLALAAILQHEMVPALVH